VTTNKREHRVTFDILAWLYEWAFIRFKTSITKIANALSPPRYLSFSSVYHFHVTWYLMFLLTVKSRVDTILTYYQLSVFWRTWTRLDNRLWGQNQSKKLHIHFTAVVIMHSQSLLWKFWNVWRPTQLASLAWKAILVQNTTFLWFLGRSSVQH
jgi:hypothetical protein